jgi:hypothetical protein
VSFTPSLSNVGRADDLVERRRLVTLHRGLQRVDGIDFRDDDARALALKGLRAALADVAAWRFFAVYSPELRGQAAELKTAVWRDRHTWAKCLRNASNRLS